MPFLETPDDDSALNILEQYLELLITQSVYAGKYSILFWLAIRSTIIIQLTSSTFEEELEYFDCDTRMIGCRELCFNRFSPISLQRYWFLQMVICVLPGVIFLVFAFDGFKKQNGKEQNQTNIQLESAYQTFGALYLDFKQEPFYKNKSCSVKTYQLSAFYMASSILKLILELLFSYIQFQIFPYFVKIDNQYTCKNLYPCEGTVNCWPVRPTEKSLFILIWYGLTLVQIGFNLAEIFRIGFEFFKR